MYHSDVQPLARAYRDFSALLATHRVRYLIVGGFALAAHGLPRSTKELDVWIDLAPANAIALLAALADFGFASLGLVENDFTAPDVVVQLGYEPNRIDLRTSVTGADFASGEVR